MSKSNKGTWGMRALVHALTLGLAILVFWILGFFLGDIKTIPGPEYGPIHAQFVDSALEEKQITLSKQLADLDRTLAAARDEVRLVGDTSSNLQSTINQLLELQRMSIEKEVLQSDSEKQNLSTSLAQFLESQKQYQELNQRISTMSAEKVRLETELEALALTLEEQTKPATEEYQRLMRAHNWRLAAYQLAMLTPLLFIAAFLLMKRKGSMYYPLFLAVGGGILVQVVLVMHEYFPSRYFKYILIGALLIVVVRVLVQVIRLLAHPRPEALRRQYREAYERFLCPVCEFPIRTGPRRWLYWTRRTVHKVYPQMLQQTTQEERYTCPACGSALLDSCPSCQRVRHTMLPHCEHCGASNGDSPAISHS
ncbi:MAG TPA: hypothetical protein PLJ47_10505 [Candidatus Hydrogenedentes bacterium]|nr:hypothetical protein [Candidatus Hydrogenedentota bacterium]